MARALHTLASLLALLLLKLQPALCACTELTSDLVDFPHCLELQVGNYSLAWKTDADNIWLALDLTTNEDSPWAGFGLSEAGGMKGSDLVVVAKQAQGGLLVQDLWSEKFGLPDLDSEQDVVLVAPLVEGQAADNGTPADVAGRLKEKPGHLRALLRRPLHACDTRDLSVTVGLPQPFVWAYGTDWPNYHGRSDRGNTYINFVPLEGDTVVTVKPDGPLPDNVYTIDLHMPNVTIPTDTTSYLCTHLQLPSDRKYHIIAQEGIIQSPLVHHIILYACPRPQAAEGDLIDCINLDPECQSFQLGWAPGMGYMEYPSNVGLPFGKDVNGGEAQTWFSMQVHYSNPLHIESATPDASGLQLTYTSELREHEMGVLLSAQNNLHLPPGKSRVVATPSLCPAECTSQLSQPVTMLYTLLHMHQTGAAISTRHFRGGVELPPLARRSVWDFNFQAMTPVPFETRELRPGDSLITQCTFNTVGRTNVTMFGQSTLDEMCMDFIWYYPKQAIQNCYTIPPFTVEGTTFQWATCLPGFPLINGTSIDDLPPQEQTQAMLQVGFLVNATWPTSHTKYQDPACTSPSSSSAQGV